MPSTMLRCGRLWFIFSKGEESYTFQKITVPQYCNLNTEIRYLDTDTDTTM